MMRVAGYIAFAASAAAQLAFYVSARQIAVALASGAVLVFLYGAWRRSRLQWDDVER